MKLALVSFLLGLAVVSAAVDLQNPDFELPPSQSVPNASVHSVPLNENNTIPGWTSSGTVQYVTSGPTVALPRNNGHGVLLAEDGNINQTFVANGDKMVYLLTFTLGMGGSKDCATNVSLLVSAPDSDSEFNLKQNYSKVPWQTYGYRLGSWNDGEPVNLVLHSQTLDIGDSNSTVCWPVLDNLSLKTVGASLGGKDNLLSNGGFEVGPSFGDGNAAGVLLDSEPSFIESALQDWSVTGTIRYIDSKSFYVPEGDAAVEIVSGSGDAAGIQVAPTLTEGWGYTVEFMLGDANDSCAGDFTVGVQAGSSAQNFTVQSKGTGSATKYSMNFKAGASPTQISFQSYTARQNKDGVFCGPVIDAVVLQTSDGRISSDSHGRFPLAIFLLVALLLQINSVS